MSTEEGAELRQRQKTAKNEDKNVNSDHNRESTYSSSLPPNNWNQFGGDGADMQHVHAPTYRTASEYSQAVQQWLWQYQMWNQMNWFYMSLPFYACNINNSLQQPQLQQTCLGNGPVPPLAAAANRFPSPTPTPQPQPPIHNGVQARPAATNQRGQEFKIPPLWKRVSAEFIDFFLLFVVKLGVTIFFVEYIGLIDLQHYDLEYLMTADMDYNTAFAMTSELVAMEIVNRVFICIFETLCLRKGLAGTIGGTTPGKRMMGLKVISCREVVDIPGGNRVSVLPAGNIGAWNAFVRSLIKNFSLAFFFPVCLTVFFFQHNRAAYDIISNCIVVESTDPLPGRWR